MIEYPQPVEAWKTSDGELHESKEEADVVQVHLDFRQWYDEHEIVAGPRRLEFDEFVQWLEEGTNEQTLLGFLRGREG